MLDGKTLFVPETQLTRRVVPVSTFLFVGSWQGTFKANGEQKPLCALDLKANSLTLLSPEKLLAGAKTAILNQETSGAFLDGISWSKNQSTHFAFKVVSLLRQSAVIELFADSYVVLYNNGKRIGEVGAGKAARAGGRAYLPITLEKGDNVILVKQQSNGAPRLQAVIYLDRSRDLQVAWQTQGGLLKKLVYASDGRAGVPELDWNPHLGNVSISLEVRDMGTNDIVLKREHARRGKLLGGEEQNFAPGIYRITYRTRTDSASEFFIVGNPPDLFANLQEKLSKHNPDAASKLNIEALLRRARILLAKDNYNLFDREWQEKAAWTFSSIATIERRLKEGVTNIAKDQPGLHIRSFASKVDGSPQFYRLFVPSKYDPDVPMPLLVIVSTRVRTSRPFIEGPVMANHREARLWSRYSEKHGAAILWPGYAGSPDGYSYESVHVNTAIQAVEHDFNIDKHRIGVYARCGAGYNAGQLVSEYDKRFSFIVYDRAVFNLTLAEGKYPASVHEWMEATNPIPRVLENRNLKLFVMHDDTKPAGHGEMALTTQFLEQAKGIRDDVVSHVSKQPMTEASRADKVLSWLTECRNDNPNSNLSRFMAKAGYTGPILEIFATPTIIVVGSHATNDHDQEIIQRTVESLAAGYEKWFHGAKCTIKVDDDLTEDNIKNHSLILVGNPRSNSVWKKLEPRIPLVVTSEKVSYKNATITEKHAFQAIVRNPDAVDKYVLMIGAADLQNLRHAAMEDIFRAWYDCIVFSTPRKTIGKLDGLPDAQSNKNSEPIVNRKP